MDELERQLRDANPLATRRTSPLSDRAESELSTLLTAEAGAAPAQRRRRRALPAIGFATAAAMAVSIAIVLAVTNVGHPTPQSVAAPPLLQATELGDSLDDVLARLSERARNQGGTSTPGQTIRYESWAAQIDAESTFSSYFVQPAVNEMTWRPDFSGSWLSRAGEVRYGKPSNNNPAATPGTVLQRDEFGPGENPMAFYDVPPTDAGELDAYLRGAWGLPDPSESFDYFTAIEGLRLEWNLTGPQSAAALELIGQLPDVELAGTVTDRLGREGIAIQTERASGTHRMILVFSPETGELLSSELVYLGGIPDFHLEFPTVMNYFAWKD